MKETPDLSRMISLIMENPKLIEEISKLAEGEEKSEEIKEDSATEPVMATREVSGYESETKRASRTKLLGAMKSYLSPERARAVDTMMSILDILEISGRR